jgi:hypothetical protein
MLHPAYEMRTDLRQRVNVYRLGIFFKMRETIYIRAQDY